MSECTHDCSTCGEACASREPESFLKPLHEGASVKKVIAVVSGKGGVGKSLVTSLLASEMQRRGRRACVYRDVPARRRDTGEAAVGTVGAFRRRAQYGPACRLRAGRENAGRICLCAGADRLRRDHRHFYGFCRDVSCARRKEAEIVTLFTL